ncbi:MAG TPA: heparinase II/III family protein, partial [Pyrinomonadaceae bacterium]|nr:heparinase II/III family protein [Pyrinomonadaceae bacterium]
WRLSSGHAHPDAGSFIIWSKGKYLTGDSGYAGVPLTEHHNTVVFGGKGQAKEGTGHDVWVDVPYGLLDQIHLSDVKFDEKKLSLTADLTTAYQPELGVKSFLRRLTFNAPGDWVVEDEIKTSKPQMITSYLHADNKIAENGKNLFELEPGGTSLWAEVLSPQPFDSKIEKNILIAPGKPGSVDKGESEERGVRLAISTPKPVDAAKFTLHLKVK